MSEAHRNASTASSMERRTCWPLPVFKRRHQRRRDRLRRRHGRQLVGQHRADEARALPRRSRACTRRQARERLHDRIVDRLPGVGALLAEAVDRDVDDLPAPPRGSPPRRCRAARPRRGGNSAPARRRSQHSRFTSSTPSAVFRSMVTERLLRLRLRNEAEKPLLAVAVGARVVACRGSSTLITSAPWSARIMVAHGPDSIEVRSTTRMPANGPMINVLQTQDAFDWLTIGFATAAGTTGISLSASGGIRFLRASASSM